MLGRGFIMFDLKYSHEVLMLIKFLWKFLFSLSFPVVWAVLTFNSIYMNINKIITFDKRSFFMVLQIELGSHTGKQKLSLTLAFPFI